LILAHLNLFTNKFPFIGGETFLELEIEYLAKKFDNIDIYPLESGESSVIELPDNVKVRTVESKKKIRISKLLGNNLSLLIRYFFFAFLKDKDRFKYISEFKYNWNRLMGIMNVATLLQREVQHSKPQTIHYSYWFNDWASMLSICRLKGIQGKFVVRTHGYDYDRKQNGRGYFPFRWAEMKAFDKVCSISDYGQGLLVDEFNHRDCFKIYRLGVSKNNISPIAENGIYKIVTCSNFVKLKRIPLIIDILSELEVPFEWIHFGSGSVNETETTKKYAEQKLAGRKFSFYGQIENKELLHFYSDNSVDLFMNLSELEGIPVSLMEAIAAGIPIVGCDVCGVPEIVTDKTGLLLPANPDSKEEAARIEDFLINKSRDMNFRKGVQEFWDEHYNAEKNYPLFIEEALLN
jgi:glycosyltransferase involved in cell wall biosynthesis